MKSITTKRLLGGSAFMALATLLFVASRSSLAADPPATQPQAAGGDDHLNSLMDELVNVEQSIDAVSKALKQAGYKVVAASDKVTDAQNGNEKMDRNGGGPVNWRDFYGATARDFASSRYQSNVFWHGRHSAGAVHVDDAEGQLQRPSQFDYVYRANNDEAARAQQQVDSLGQQKDALLARRRRLEAEQSALWAAVTFESIEDRDIPLRPLYRNQLKMKGANVDDDNKPADPRLAAMYASVLSLRITEHAVSALADDLKDNQEKVALVLRDTLKDAQAKLAGGTANFQQADGVSAAESDRMNATAQLVKRLYGECQDMCDAYQAANEGDAASDDLQKQFARGKLQQSMMKFSASVGDLDDELIATADAWNITPAKRHVYQYDLPTVNIASAPSLPAAAPPPTVAPASTAEPLGAAPAAPPANDPALTNPVATLDVLFKGGKVEVYVNGKSIHSSEGKSLRKIPVSLKNGDCVVFRLSSPYRWRSVRCALIARNGDCLSTVTPEECVIRKVDNADSPAPAQPFDASHAIAGAMPRKDAMFKTWNEAHLPEPTPWISLPTQGDTYDIAFTVSGLH